MVCFVQFTNLLHVSFSVFKGLCSAISPAATKRYDFIDIYGAKYMQKVETEELLFKTKAALIP